MSLIPSPDLAEKAYDILVATCGAKEEGRRAFCEHHNDSPHTTQHLSEWRIDGVLGYGGKFKQHNGHYYVACYPEDSTPERQACLAEANRLLAALFPVAAPAGG